MSVSTSFEEIVVDQIPDLDFHENMAAFKFPYLELNSPLGNLVVRSEREVSSTADHVKQLLLDKKSHLEVNQANVLHNAARKREQEIGLFYHKVAKKLVQGIPYKGAIRQSHHERLCDLRNIDRGWRRRRDETKTSKKLVKRMSKRFLKEADLHFLELRDT